MNLSQFLPSIHFAISQLKDGSEDAQMHSFYLSKLAAQLKDISEPAPVTVVVYGDVDIKIAYAIAKHYGCSGINFEASMILAGKLNTVPERPQYEIEGVTIMSAKHCIEALGL